MSKIKNRPSEAIKNEIANLRPELILALGRHMAAQKRYNFLSEMCISALTVSTGGGESTLSNLPNQATTVISFSQSDNGKDLAAIATILDVLESSEAFIEAQELLVPLLDELEASEAAEAERSHAINLAKDAVRIAEETAKQKAIAEATADHEVLAARKALESIK